MKEQGFTLIEILVALAIFSIVVAAIITMLPGLATTNSRTRDDQVLLAAQGYFEQVRGELRNNFDSTLSTVTVPGVGSGLSCTTTTPVDLETLNGQSALKRVKLSCTINGKTHNFSLDIARTS
ncbi:type II secretion system protein J [Deinococcus malanensis]|uniref:type II secretion system protein J n=1 Tax=Deinococcus malanensis TaxID=1706855 RepID=UPI003643A5FB